MRWVVEVSSVGKTDLQKYVVEAESWQRALQAARAQRSEEGPMSGFSIELLEEGYRAVDPIAKVRFVVKRAPDDMPITAPLAKDAKGVAPSPPSIPPPSGMAPRSSSAPPPRSSSPPPSKKSVPPRPNVEKQNGPPSTSLGPQKVLSPQEPSSVAKPAPPKAAPKAAESPAAAPTLVGTVAKAPVGSAVPGLPNVKILSSREQDPTDASPLTYREYSFAVAAGTSEETATSLLRAQLKLVDALLDGAKVGKLVNLAVFDVEFTGKPPSPPLATLTWKDWKGEPVIGYPRRGAAQKQIKPPSVPPPPASGIGTAPASTAKVAFPPAPIVPAISAGPAANPTGSAAPPVPASQAAPAPAGPAVKGPSQPPPSFGAGGIPVPHVAPVATFSPTAVVAPAEPVPQPAPATAPATLDAAPRKPSYPPSNELIRTPSGRFIRGRTTGDELITALFESMHDLHFLRDALDGGQFCLALATEVLPARVAIIHFFDVEKREWVIACTRGKDSSRLLNTRTPESDELLRDAARKRRAVVLPNASSAMAQRYQAIGGGRSVIIAPIMQAGRALGAMEIINPLDGMPFTEDEGNAMTYIAEQYAEYLGSRGIVLDRNRIQAAATTK